MKDKSMRKIRLIFALMVATAVTYNLQAKTPEENRKYCEKKYGKAAIHLAKMKRAGTEAWRRKGKIYTAEFNYLKHVKQLLPVMQEATDYCISSGYREADDIYHDAWLEYQNLSLLEPVH
jgi:hypothetical protein